MQMPSNLVVTSKSCTRRGWAASKVAILPCGVLKHQLVGDALRPWRNATLQALKFIMAEHVAKNATCTYFTSRYLVVDLVCFSQLQMFCNKGCLWSDKGRPEITPRKYYRARL